MAVRRKWNPNFCMCYFINLFTITYSVIIDIALYGCNFFFGAYHYFSSPSSPVSHPLIMFLLLTTEFYYPPQLSHRTITELNKKTISSTFTLHKREFNNALQYSAGPSFLRSLAAPFPSRGKYSFIVEWTE